VLIQSDHVIGNRGDDDSLIGSENSSRSPQVKVTSIINPKSKKPLIVRAKRESIQLKLHQLNQKPLNVKTSQVMAKP
jgi:hypothetical protein